MKKITKLMALVLALALVLSLTACSGSKKTIDGSWKCSLDFSKAMEGEMLSESEDDGQMFTEEQKQAMKDAVAKMVNGVDMKMNLDLKEDKSFTMEMDEASVKASAEILKANMAEAVPALFCAMFGIEADQLDETLDQFGMSLEDLNASYAEEFNPEELLEDMEKVTGTYTYEEGKLVLTPADGDPMTLTVEFSGNELKVTGVEGEGSLKDMESLLPLVFKR